MRAAVSLHILPSCGRDDEAKRNSAIRAAVAAAYTFPYTDSGCAPFDNSDGIARLMPAKKTARSQPQKSSYLLRLVLDASPSSRAFNFAVYPRYSRAESFAQQLQLSIKSAAMTS